MQNRVDVPGVSAETGETQGSESPASPRSVSGSQGRLLLVEDEPLSQKFCQLLLNKAGYELDIAANAENALERILCCSYRSILMDVGLPDLSGIDVTRRIRAIENPNRHVPIIALTAHLDATRKQACLEAGMNAFMVKPISPHALCQLLVQVLEIQNADTA